MKDIYLFTGNEELIIKNKIDNIIKSVNVDVYNILTYDMEEVNVATAILDASTVPFMSAYKVIILKNPTFLSSAKTEINHNKKAFIRYLENPSSSTVLIINACNIKLDERKEEVVKLLKVAEVNETKELNDVEAIGWLKRQFLREGVNISDDAANMFFARVGKNLMIAKNEVDKLLNYVAGKDKITAKDVNDVVTREVETEVFALTNAIIDKDKNRIIKTYRDLTYVGKDAVQLMGLVSRSMLDTYYTKIMISLNYSQNQISELMGVSSGRAYYLIKNAKAFSIAALEENITKLANLDYKIKTGQIEATRGLEYFLFGL